MKKIPRWIQGILLLILFYLLFFLRLPYYIEAPGSIFSLDEMVEVDNRFTDAPGDFYITTVGIQKVSPVGLLTSFLPYRDLVSETDLFGNLDDFEAYNKIQEYHMKSSINNAVKVAFDAADKEYKFEHNGVYVLQVIEESSFFTDLKIGDIVKSVDGNKFESSEEFIDYIENKSIDEKVALDIKRDQTELKISGKLIELESGSTGIGIGLVDDTTLITDPTVDIHSADIGGPSAGLMFSLEVYTQLVDSNIRGSYDIAGTGTIAADGKVGRIGGIEKKVVAADKENADYFFAPDDEITEEFKEINPNLQTNYQTALMTAQEIDSQMEIIPIQTINDAIHFLEELKVEEVTQNPEDIIELFTWNRNSALEKRVAILED